MGTSSAAAVATVTGAGGRSNEGSVSLPQPALRQAASNASASVALLIHACVTLPSVTKTSNLCDETLLHRTVCLMLGRRGFTGAGFPLPQAVANVVRLQIQHGANGNERVEPAPIVAEQPFLGFVEQKPPLAAGNEQIFLIAAHAILENCKQENSLRFQGNFPPKVGGVILSQKSVRLEQRTNSLVHCVTPLRGAIFITITLRFHFSSKNIK